MRAVVAGLAALLLPGCITFYAENPEGRPMFATSADGAGFRQTRPDGSTTEVWGGNNSEGQKQLRKTILGTVTRRELGETARALSNNDLEKAKVGANTRRVTELGSLRNEVETTRIQEQGETARAAIQAAGE